MPLDQTFSPFGETRRKKGGNADRSQIGFLMDSLLISGIKAENEHVALVWGLIYQNYSTIRVYLMSK